MQIGVLNDHLAGVLYTFMNANQGDNDGKTHFVNAGEKDKNRQKIKRMGDPSGVKIPRCLIMSKAARNYCHARTILSV